MTLAYPIAKNADEALFASEDLLCKTLSQASEKAGQRVVMTSDWLRPGADASDKLRDRAEELRAHGFVQMYEDKDGNTVLGVTYWKLLTAAEAKTQDQKVEDARAARQEETTDDLYFTRPEKRRERFGLSIRRPRVKKPDPRQMDLFPQTGKPTPESPDEPGASRRRKK